MYTFPDCGVGKQIKQLICTFFQLFSKYFSIKIMNDADMKEIKKNKINIKIEVKMKMKIKRKEQITKLEELRYRCNKIGVKNRI